MPPTLRKLRLPAGALLLALASAACSDQAQTPAGPDPAVPPITPSLAAVLECRVDVRANEMVCGEAPSAPGVRELIVGGQNTNVRLRNTNNTIVADTFSFDATMENLIPQPMATSNGTTPTSTGLQIFFYSGPTTTSGTGTVTVANPDGTGTFTGPSQPYHQYAGTMLGSDGILSQFEITSSKRWKFHMPSTVQTFSFTVYVSTAVPFENGWVDITPASPAVLVGGTRALTATGRTATGATISGHTVSWSSGSPSIATVNSSGVVTGVAPGLATITATSTDNLRTGSTVVRVCPNLGLAVGGVAVLTMPGDATFCLGGGTGGAEYTVVPVNVGGTAAMSVTATGIVPVVGAPSPTLLPGGGGLGSLLRASRVAELGAAERYESRLRERELAELTPRIAALRRSASARRSAATGARRAITPGTPTVGDLMTLNVESSGSCTTASLRTGRVAVVRPNIIILADTLNPSGGLTTADYDAIAFRYQQNVSSALAAAFGAPEDLDVNGRVIAFYTTAVNAQTPTGSLPVTHGYTLRRDLFPSSACPESNQGELIYMAAADPSGTINGNVRSVAGIDSVAARTLAHEMEHLTNASRRLYVNYAPTFEDSWMDEGLAMIAQELAYYQAAELSEGTNLDYAAVTVDDGTDARRSFVTYVESNFATLRSWLRTPEVTANNAMWAFLRYSADRKGGNQADFWYAMGNSTTTGFANYEAAIGTPRNPWIRDFFMSMYTDDALTGLAADYTQPSWNFRSLYDHLDYDGDHLSDGYPLAVRNPANGVANTFSLAPNAAAYLRMGVQANGLAQVTLQAGGAAPASTLLVTVVRRK